jgi:hypothetical protein
MPDDSAPGPGESRLAAARNRLRKGARTGGAPIGPNARRPSAAAAIAHLRLLNILISTNILTLRPGSRRFAENVHYEVLRSEPRLVAIYCFFIDDFGTNGL